MTDSQSRALRPAAFLLAAAISLLSPGCGSKPQPEVAETKKFRPVDENAPAAAPAHERARANDAGASLEPASRIASNRSTPAVEPSANPPTSQSPKTASDSSKSDSSKSEPAPSPELQAIIDQINRLGNQQPRARNERELAEEVVKIHTQRIALAKQALKLNPGPELKRSLAMAMYESLHEFVGLGVTSANAQLSEFGKTMSADSDKEVARLGRYATLNANLLRATARTPDNGEDIVAEAKKLLDAERGDLTIETVQLTQQISRQLNQLGFKKDLIALNELLADALKADSKKMMVDAASIFALEAKSLGLDIDTATEDVVMDRPGGIAKAGTILETLLREVPPSGELLSRVSSLAHLLEAFGDPASAKAAYTQITAAFKSATDPELVQTAQDLETKANIRLALIGQPFSVEGVTIEGSPFDWSAYAGKVVLIDFWATWCGPCLQEIPNIRRNFEQYHAKGFEVVGVNLNVNAGEFKEFMSLQGQAIPWPSVTSQVVLDGKADEKDWSKIPMAAKCGVTSIPFVVLVGKDGIVDSIHVRGPKLGKRLRELLGDPITTEVPTDPTQPKAAPKGTGFLRPNLSPLRIAATIAIALAGSKLSPGPLADEPPADEATNPYLAKPDLTTQQLVAYIQKMLDRPQTIQTRPGFADGIADACDRILRAEKAASAADQLFAVQTKLNVLHREACDGKDSADQRLMEFVDQLKNDERPEVAREVAFYRMERRVLGGKTAPIDEVPALLTDLQKYLAAEKLTAKHLRLASATVAAINRLESGEEREKQFALFGKLFSLSPDKEVARYGKKIAGKKSAG